jgi:tetratricopeptide (TPR) repeat protein
MKEAIDRFNGGQYPECIDACTKEIAAANEHALEARNLRGSLLMLKCEYAKATDDFEAVLASEGHGRLKANTCIKLTALNLQRGEEDEAFDNYERAIGFDPDNEDIYCNRAQVFAMKARFDECFKDFQRWVISELNFSIR